MKRRGNIVPSMGDLRFGFAEITLKENEEFNEDAEFEVLTSDKQYDSRYGSFRYAEKNLQEIADNFNDNVRGVEIAVDKNHDRSKQAYAWIRPQSARVGDSTLLKGHKSLFVKLYRYTPEGLELMKTGAFRYFSVELLLRWTRFKDGVKKSFKNVLFGLALTNSPVVKDMKAAFAEENGEIYLSTNILTMDLFKQFLSLLKGKEIVTKDEKETMKSMYIALEEDEQETVKEEVAEVESKEEAPAEDKELAEIKEKLELAEKEAKEAKDKLDASDKKLTESEKDAAKDGQRLSELEAKVRKTDLEKIADAFALSEDINTGFVEKDKEAVVAFLSTLDDEQVKGFQEVVALVKYVEFGEAGSEDTKETDKKEETEDAANEKKAKALATKISKEQDIPLHEALSEAYSELGMV